MLNQFIYVLRVKFNIHSIDIFEESLDSRHCVRQWGKEMNDLSLEVSKIEWRKQTKIMIDMNKILRATKDMPLQRIEN